MINYSTRYSTLGWEWEYGEWRGRWGKRGQKYETVGRYGEEEQWCGTVEGIREMEGEMGK